MTSQGSAARSARTSTGGTTGGRPCPSRSRPAGLDIAGLRGRAARRRPAADGGGRPRLRWSRPPRRSRLDGGGALRRDRSSWRGPTVSPVLASGGRLTRWSTAARAWRTSYRMDPDERMCSLDKRSMSAPSVQRSGHDPPSRVPPGGQPWIAPGGGTRRPRLRPDPASRSGAGSRSVRSPWRPTSAWPVSTPRRVARSRRAARRRRTSSSRSRTRVPAPVDLAGLEVVYATSSGSTVTRKATWAASTLLQPGRRVLHRERRRRCSRRAPT